MNVNLANLDVLNVL